MASLKKMLGDMMGSLLFRELVVQRVSELAPRFVRIDLGGHALKTVDFTPGDKVQVFLDGDFRTYTPFAFDHERLTMSLLVYSHGDAPGSLFGQRVREGDKVRVFGPRRSLALGQVGGPLVLVGDETTFALARAFADQRGSGATTQLLFEVGETGAEQVLEALDLEASEIVARTPNDAHVEVLGQHLVSALAREPRSQVVLAGKASTIQTLRKLLRAANASHGAMETKAYWAPGKRGLD